MHRLTVIVGLVITVLGFLFSPATAADPIGPACFVFHAFPGSYELFFLPSGGENFVITGRHRQRGTAVTGSGFLDGQSFVFYLFASECRSCGATAGAVLANPGTGLVFEGFIDSNTLVGVSRFQTLNSDSTGNSSVSVFTCS
jgi:hypothetical protein